MVKEKKTRKSLLNNNIFKIHIKKMPSLLRAFLFDINTKTKQFTQLVYSYFPLYKFMVLFNPAKAKDLIISAEILNLSLRASFSSNDHSPKT